MNDSKHHINKNSITAKQIRFYPCKILLYTLLFKSKLFCFNDALEWNSSFPKKEKNLKKTSIIRTFEKKLRQLIS